MFKNFPTLSRQFYLNKKVLKKSCKLKLKSLSKNSNFVLTPNTLICFHVKSSFSKTFYTLTGLNGKIILTLRSGDKRVGQFINKRKRFSNNALASTLQIFINVITKLKIRKLILILNGFIKQRTFIIKKLLRAKIKVFFIKYNSKLPHNGCRLPKPRSGFKL